MNNDREKLIHIAPMVHSDNVMEKMNEVIGRVAVFTRSYNGEPEPKVDYVLQFATANNLLHLPRNVQEAAFKAANPHVNLDPAAPLDPVTEWAMANGMGSMDRTVQQAAFDASQTGARVPSVEA